jgi:hypothetical protein
MCYTKNIKLEATSPIDRFSSVCRALFIFRFGGEITANAFITINGKAFPSPGNDLNFLIATTITAGRNANNEVIGQKVGRDQYKMDNLVWPDLTAAVWSEMLLEFEKFKIYVRFPDMVHNSWITLWMYCGDRSAKPFPGKIDPETGLPTEYLQCKCNIIDYGLMEN